MYCGYSTPQAPFLSPRSPPQHHHLLSIRPLQRDVRWWEGDFRNFSKFVKGTNFWMSMSLVIDAIAIVSTELKPLFFRGKERKIFQQKNLPVQNVEQTKKLKRRSERPSPRGLLSV